MQSDDDGQRSKLEIPITTASKLLPNCPLLVSSVWSAEAKHNHALIFFLELTPSPLFFWLVSFRFENRQSPTSKRTNPLSSLHFTSGLSSMYQNTSPCTFFECKSSQNEKKTAEIGPFRIGRSLREEANLNFVHDHYPCTSVDPAGLCLQDLCVFQ